CPASFSVRCPPVSGSRWFPLWRRRPPPALGRYPQQRALCLGDGGQFLHSRLHRHQHIPLLFADERKDTAHAARQFLFQHLIVQVGRVFLAFVEVIHHLHHQLPFGTAEFPRQQGEPSIHRFGETDRLRVPVNPPHRFLPPPCG